MAAYLSGRNGDGQSIRVVWGAAALFLPIWHNERGRLGLRVVSETVASDVPRAEYSRRVAELSVERPAFSGGNDWSGIYSWAWAPSAWPGSCSGCATLPGPICWS